MFSQETYAMTQSPMDWIGLVPLHWQLTRFGDVIAMRPKKSVANVPPGALSFGRVVEKKDDFPEETKSTYQEVLPGDFLINPINLNYDLKSLRTAKSDVHVCVSPAYIVATASQESPDFIKWLLYDFDLRYMKTLGAGVRQTLTFQDVKKCLIHVPPLLEQQSIANFLDRETSIIDEKIGLISRKQGLLAELRKAIIHDAVTKGLDKAVCLKNSSVNWIGEIPLDWHIARIKDVAKVGAGNPAPQPSLISDDNSEMPFLRVSDLSKCVNDIAIKTRDHVAEPISFGLKIWPKGTIVFPKSGESIRTNARAMLDRNMTVVSHLACLKANAKIFNPFLFWLLKAVNFENEINQTALPALGINDIENFKIPLPPLQMQQRIVDHLDATVFRLNRIESLLRRQAELLKEQRQALIHEVVTGKMRVI